MKSGTGNVQNSETSNEKEDNGVIEDNRNYEARAQNSREDRRRKKGKDESVIGFKTDGRKGDKMNRGENIEVGYSSARFMSWNVEGLFNKLSDDDFVDYITSFHFCCLCETFTYNSFDFDVKFNDFIHAHCPATKFTRMGRPSGGVIVLVKEELRRFIEVIETNIKQVLCIKINKNWLNTEKDIMFIGTYVHPVSSVFYTDKDYNNTLEMIEQFIIDQIDQDKDYSYIIGGDLNARIGDWGLISSKENDENNEEDNRYERISQDQIINGFGNKLIEICTTFDLTPTHGLTEKQFDGNFTFYAPRGNSTIDYFLCSTELYDRSDHRL